MTIGATRIYRNTRKAIQMLELYTQKDMGEEKSKIWLMQKLNTHHWRLSANQPLQEISPSSGMLTAPSSFLSVCTLSTSGSSTFSLRMR